MKKHWFETTVFICMMMLLVACSSGTSSSVPAETTAAMAELTVPDAETAAVMAELTEPAAETAAAADYSGFSDFAAYLKEKGEKVEDSDGKMQYQTTFDCWMKEYLCECPVDTNDKRSVTAKAYYTGDNPSFQDMEVMVKLESGNNMTDYEMHCPAVSGDETLHFIVKGTFDRTSYQYFQQLESSKATVDDGREIGPATKVEMDQLASDMVNILVKSLDDYLAQENPGFDIQQLGFSRLDYKAAESAKLADNSKPKNAGSSGGTTSFTNKYGTPTTKCVHPGCNNYIADSGDTNCCTTHSAKCLNCGKYIDEDAMYCMDCITGSVNKKNSSGASGSSNNTVSNSAKCQFRDSNGNQTCTNKAMSGGKLCEYHYNYLKDVYDQFTGN